ncbi:hypothetical protein ACFOZ0_03170 [Streptomyces yaanensis]|uniref:Integral membrane protein n=1 Tax=Streptomyces yaanensis TaxID=1142239 RepID=A0ABV7S7Q7_9ACTN|nr:hypothetical protein [Streptomyces sp. CGMCC 4.7035]WNB99878.1 hypothetical protein Q2K21_18390 [Streptomyces sp. CGMCC 4.7035]
MTTARRGRPGAPAVRWWRWRRSPLRRRSDVVEAWIVLAAWLFALVAGVCAGLATADAVDQRFVRQRAERRAVRAVLVRDAPEHTDAREVGGRRVLADVRWTAADGSLRQTRTRVTPGTAAGTRITLWTDRQGVLRGRPVAPAEAAVTAVTFGALAAGAAGGGVGWAGTRAVRLCVDRRRMEQWAKEWARLDSRADPGAG